MSEFTLHLLRHGEPEGAGRLLGHSDARPLTFGMAACVARGIGLVVEQVVSSDLSRASAPALAIANALDVPHRSDCRWRELDFGQWEGSDPATLPQARLRTFWNDPVNSPPPGGEDWAALCTRVEAALGEVDCTTLVVAHAGAIRAALASLLGWSHDQTWTLSLPYAALVSLTIWPGEQRGAQITGLVT